MTYVVPDEYARRENVWLRMLLMAPTGGGKTTGALEVATNLFGGDLPVVGVDTERDRMKLYATRYRFRHVAMVDDYSPGAFIDVIDSVERAIPGGVMVLDSFSHEWMGKGGILQIADGKFGGWKVARPKHQDVMDRLMATQLHLIVCVRSKMKYEVNEVPRESGTGTKQEISKVGIGPVQDEATIYEFDVVGDIDAKTHICTFSNRCDDLVDTERSLMPGTEVADILTRWLSDGEPPEPPQGAGEDEIKELRESLLAEGIPQDKIDLGFAVARRANRGRLHPDYVSGKYAESQARLADRKPGAAAPAEAGEGEAVGAPYSGPVDVPAGEPGEEWRVAQIDAYAALEGVEGYPASSGKSEKLKAVQEHYAAALAAHEAAAAEEGVDDTIEFGEKAASEGQLV